MTLRKKWRHEITQADLLLFFQQLSSLVSAGTTLQQSLSIILQTERKRTYRILIQTIYHDIECGKELNHSLQRFPHYFDLLICHLIRIGEQTGTLDTMLKRVCSYLEKKSTLYKQVKQAFIYPCILSIAAIIMLLFMLYFIVPQFNELFEHFSKKLPLMTRIIVYASLRLHHTGPFTFILFISGITMLIMQTEIKFNRVAYNLSRLPFFKKIIKKILLARLARNLSTTLAAAVPLTEALTLISPLFHHTPLAEYLHLLYTEVHSGKRFYASLETSSFFPSLLIQMTRTGEESGTLEQMLAKFADIYEADIQRMIHISSHILEPLIIAIVGVLIGGIVVAMYLPLFQLGTVLS